MFVPMTAPAPAGATKARTLETRNTSPRSFTRSDAADVDRPLVLVGHSYGGLYARQYAAMYPADVAGMVLVDSAHPDQWTRHLAAAEQFAAMVGSMSEPIDVAPPDPPPNPDLPPSASKRMAVEGNTVKHLNTTRAEFLATTATNDQVRRSSVHLGGIPLVVLSATQLDFPPELQEQMEAIHLRLQEELATLSSHAVLHLAVADHNGSLRTGRRVTALLDLSGTS